MESFLIDSRRWGVVLPFLAIAKQQLEEEERGFIKDITVFGKCTHTKLSERNSGKLVQGFFLFVIVFLRLAGRTCVRMYLGIFSFSDWCIHKYLAYLPWRSYWFGETDGDQSFRMLHSNSANLPSIGT